MGSIAVVGSVAYDSVETPFGKVTEALGGAATYFSIAAAYFTEVRLAAPVGNDFRQQDVSLLESRNIDLAGLEVLPGKTFRWAGEYGYDLNDCQTLDTQLNVLADYRPNLPEHYRTSEYLFLGNFDPELQRQVLLQVRQAKLVACDTMNYWIQEHFPSLLETLKGVGILLINDAEARQLSREPNLVRAAEKILGWGPRILVVKRGEYGALMFRREAGGGLDIFGAPAYPLADVLDPTGAGDTFAGGFMGYLAGTGRSDRRALRQAVIFGSVMASFTVEGFSLDRLKEVTLTEIEMRYRELQRMTRFEDFAQPREKTLS